MKKRIWIFGLLIAAAMLYLIIFHPLNSREHIPDDWPGIDKMERNLLKKGYDVILSNEIHIDGGTSVGERLTAEKGNNFIDAFWCINNEPIESIQKFCSESYNSDYTLTVGYTVYCGTKNAIKDSGIILRNY